MFTQCSPRLHVCWSVTHSLMSVGREREAIRGYRGQPGWWLSAAITALEVLATRKAAHNWRPPVRASIQSVKMDGSSHCHLPASTGLGTEDTW